MCLFVNRLSQEPHNKLILKTGKLKQNFVFLRKRCSAKKLCSGFPFWSIINAES